MASLRRSDAEVAKARFYDRARSGDLVPIDRNAQPRVVRSPAPNTNQQIRTILRAQNSVVMRHSLCHFPAAAALKTLRIDHDNIVQILNAAVPEDFAATADQL